MRRRIFGRGAFALAVSGAVMPAQWGAVTTTTAPSPRAGALLAHDPVGNRTLLFGGNWANDFWSLANGTWTQLTPAVLPGPRARADLAADPLSGTIVLYGGDDGVGQFAVDETWSFSGGVWQQLAPATTPLGLARHAMAFDIVRQIVVLFGGRSNSWAPNQAFADTWEFANGTWQLATPLQSPPALRDHAMAWHPGRQQVLLFGGIDTSGQPSDQTWAYDGVTWVQLNLTGTLPPARTMRAVVRAWCR
jgi:hypothetical protein